MPEGITHAAVQLVSTGALGAIVEPDLDVSNFKDNDEELMTAVITHDQVLGQLFKQTPLLPLRFGTQFTHEASLQTYLMTHEKTHLNRLGLLSQKAEYLIKLSPRSQSLPPLDESLKGRSYFLAKKQRLQVQTQTQTQQTAELQDFFTHLKDTGVEFIQGESREEEAARLHLLLERDAEIAQSQIMSWQQQLSCLQLDCSEPLPPYHFAG